MSGTKQQFKMAVTPKWYRILSLLVVLFRLCLSLLLIHYECTVTMNCGPINDFVVTSYVLALAAWLPSYLQSLFTYLEYVNLLSFNIIRPNRIRTTMISIAIQNICNCCSTRGLARAIWTRRMDTMNYARTSCFKPRGNDEVQPITGSYKRVSTFFDRWVFSHSLVWKEMFVKYMTLLLKKVLLDFFVEGPRVFLIGNLTVTWIVYEFYRPTHPSHRIC